MVSASNQQGALPVNAGQHAVESMGDLGAVAHLEHVKRRYWGRYVASAVIVVLLGYIALAFAHGQIEWRYVGRFLTARSI
nr:hypothetical protein [Paraburkholderia terrae]